MTIVTFDSLLDRITTGDNLGVNEITELAATNDILSLGMLADVVRRRLHGTQVTYLRVETWDPTMSLALRYRPQLVRFDSQACPSRSSQLSVPFRPPRLWQERTVAGFSWPDVERLAANGGVPGMKPSPICMRPVLTWQRSHSTWLPTSKAPSRSLWAPGLSSSA